MSDLTASEQDHVRAALRFLHAQLGTWTPLEKALRLRRQHLASAASGYATVGASLAVRVARLASVGVDDVLAGRFPPSDVCPHCGSRKEAAAAAR